MLVTNFWFKYAVYRVVCGAYQALDVGRMHPLRERAIRALNETVDYIDKAMPDAVGYETQKEVTEYALRQATEPGHLLEFGVFTGGTIRFMSKRVGGRVIHGFDSFEGLPEDWGGFSMDTESFNVKGKLPKVPGNVTLHSGWFENSLPKWCKQHPGPVAFMHIDCDIYSSTKTIFEALKERMRAGTVILFDEYFNYPGWKLHEFKAFAEFVAQYGVEYEYLAYARQQVVVRITKPPFPDGSHG